MRLAQHLAVINIRAAALAPCCHMVGIHFIQFPYTLTVGIMTDGAVGAVTHALGDFHNYNDDKTSLY